MLRCPALIAFRVSVSDSFPKTSSAVTLLCCVLLSCCFSCKSPKQSRSLLSVRKPALVYPCAKVTFSWRIGRQPCHTTVIASWMSAFCSLDLRHLFLASSPDAGVWTALPLRLEALPLQIMTTEMSLYRCCSAHKTCALPLHDS